MRLQHEVCEDNLNPTPHLHLDGVDLVLVIRVVSLSPARRGHQIVAVLVAIHFVQKAYVRVGEPSHVAAEITGGGILGCHGGPCGPGFLKGIIPVVHDAAAVIRGPVSLALCPLALSVLGKFCRSYIVLIHDDVIVTI